MRKRKEWTEEDGQFIRYRNEDGRPLELVNSSLYSTNVEHAFYILCPESRGLKAIKVCMQCENFVGRTDTDVVCKSRAKFDDPYNPRTVLATDIFVKL